MKNFIRSSLVLVFLSTSSFAASVERIPLREYDLMEFELDTSSSGATGIVKCTEEEIKSGLMDLIWLSSRKESPGRDLVGSVQPLDRLAAWFIHNNQTGCQSMAPYFNGVGFESINLATGSAVAYITAFNKTESRNDGSQISKMREAFQPEFTRINTIKFQGSCSYVKAGLVVSLWESDIVNCSFGKSGYIKLKKR